MFTDLPKCLSQGRLKGINFVVTSFLNDPLDTQYNSLRILCERLLKNRLKMTYRIFPCRNPYTKGFNAAFRYKSISAWKAMNIIDRGGVQLSSLREYHNIVITWCGKLHNANVMTTTSNIRINFRRLKYFFFIFMCIYSGKFSIPGIFRNQI